MAAQRPQPLSSLSHDQLFDGWLVGQPTGRSVDWSVSRLVSLGVGQLVSGLVQRPAVWVDSELVDIWLAG